MDETEATDGLILERQEMGAKRGMGKITVK